jgi:SAM-dependent methyltransferase
MPVATIRSPKRRPRSQPSRADWFRYYADFSGEFVEDVISHLDLDSDATLLDPWLGGGTTAEVATAKGIRFKGYDINPAMLLVSRARTIPTEASNQIPSLVESITRSYKKRVKNVNESDDGTDQLEQWLQPASSRAFRILERSVESCLCDPETISRVPLWRRTGQASPVLSLFYVALFRTLRHFIWAFESSNPTWVKVVDEGKRIQLSPDRILNRFHKEIRRLSESIRAEPERMPASTNRSCLINRASSLRLPLDANSIDAAVSSPPYCTRIDYVRATLPELAVIGHPNGRVIRRLRERMIGTPTIDECEDYETEDWGTTCSRFLSVVERHTSKASSTYYLKYYHQYFASIFASLKEIDRVLKPSGQCVLVVQDSYYKDKKNNLPRMFIEMAAHYGWSLDKKKPFHVNQTLAGVNPDVKAYRNTFHATEWALVFSK